MRKKLILLFFITAVSNYLLSQGCSLVSFTVSPSGSSTSKRDTTVCKNSNLTLTASIPMLKQTTSYAVASVPYIDTLPCETVGSVIGGAGINQDDQYSPVQNIGFNFCYYGNQYSQVTICDNGYVTFTLSKANTTMAPFTAQSLPLAATSTVPPNTILGAMMDVLVATNYTPPGGGTISVQTVGSAPFRAFIIKWNDARYFASSCRTNTAIRLNMKIVLYETTNMIDVYIKTKPLCTSGASTLYNTTQGLVGPTITTQFIVSPGRNNSLWDGANSAFRFTPNGANYSSSIQWSKNGAVISNLNTANITAVDDSAFYVATANITASCPTATNLVIKDSIKVVGINNVVAKVNVYDTIQCKDSMILNATKTGVTKYVWDNGALTPTRTVYGSGVYYAVRRYDTLGCNRDTIFFYITKNSKLKIDSFQRIGCFNSLNSGQIKLFASGDTIGSKYGTIPYPTNNVNLIPNQKYGSQTYWVRNSGSCVDSITIFNDSIAYNYSKRNNYCIQDSSGMMKMTPLGGYPPFIFSLTGRSNQLIDSFTKLSGGIYTIGLTDKIGCNLTKTDTIVPNTNLAINILTDSVSCFAGNNGKITAVLTGGVPNYKYSINNGSFVSSGIFTGLTVGSYLIKTSDSAKCTIDTTIQIYQYADIQAVLTKNKNCPFNSNGSVSISSSGGKPPYQYKLNSGTFQVSNLFSNLLNGNFNITIKDANNCTKTLFDTILSHPKPDISLASKKDLSCYQSNDGKIKVITTNGTAPYSYNWSIGGIADSIVNLPIGIYRTTVTDFNLCKDTLITSVTQPDTIQSNFILKNPLCFNQNNGTIKVIATGGTAPYQYAINTNPYNSVDSFIGLGATSYTITIKDTNQCTKSFTRTLVNPTKLTASIVVDSVSCFGGNNGKIIVNGIAAKPPYTYKINSGSYTSINIFNALSVGTYSLSLRDSNNCQFDTSASVFQYPIINLGISIIDTIRCKNGSDGKISIMSTGGNPPYSYSINGGSYQTSNIFSGLNKGKKIINVKDANNCIKIDSITLSEPLGITTTLTIQNQVKCYGESNGKARVVVTGGIIPYTFLWSNGGSLDSVTNLNAGLKYIKILDSRSCTDSIPFIITQPDSLKASFNLYNPRCFNTLGSIKILPQGGTTPYQYSINASAFNSIDSISNLTGQNYNLTIRDANLCSVSYSQTLITPPPISANYIVDSVKCFGASTGKININASGGIGTLLYKKNNVLQPNNIFFGLGMGVYSVQILDANNCTLDSNINVYQYPDITANYSANNVKCFGANTGSIIVNATGGAGGLVYAINSSSFSSSNSFLNLASGLYVIKIQDKYLCQKNQNINISQIDSMKISIQKENNPCFGDSKGKIKLFVTDGTPPYQFSFNGGAYSSMDSIINLPANSYTYSVKDSNGCIKNGVIAITQPPPLGISTIVDSVKCFGLNTGRIQLIAAGGTPSYSYSIGTSSFLTGSIFNSLTAGSYYLRIRDNNLCIKDTTVNILSSDSFYLSYILDSLKCNNQAKGKLTITAFGGTPPYLYNIDGGAYSSNSIISNIQYGAHSVSVKDNYGCLLSFSFNLSNPSPIAINLINLVNNDCNGDAKGKIEISSSGGRLPHSYNWTNGNLTTVNTNLVSNNYTVTVTDANACQQSLTYNISQPPPFTFNVSKRDLRCYGDKDAFIQTTISGSNPPYMYKWNIDSITPSVSNLLKGTYTITITDSKLCTSSRSFSILEPSAINFSLNKVNSSCVESKNGSAEIVNLIGGTTPYSYNWNNGAIGSKVNNLIPFNTYKVTVSDANNCKKMDSIFIDTTYKLRVDLSYISFPKCPKSPVSVRLNPISGVAPFEYKVGTFINDSGKFISIPNQLYKVEVIDVNGCFYDSLVDMRPKDTLVVRLVNYDPLCEVGNIFTSKLYVTGGTKPYTYQWPGAFKVLGDSALHNAKGVYDVIVTDASNCVVNKKFFLSPPEFALNGSIIDKINLRCYKLPEGKMTAFATGGSVPYRYQWSTNETTATISKLSAKVLYTVTISDALNCNYIVFDSLSQADSMSVNIKVNDLSCVNKNDGSMTLLPFGGTAPNNLYTFSLDSHGTFQKERFFMPLTEGKYKVFIKDENSCIIENEATINVKNKISLQIDSLYETDLGKEIELKPYIMLNPYTNNVIYQWIPSEGLSCVDCTTPVFNGYISDKYTLRVQYGNGCLDSTSTYVKVRTDSINEIYIPNSFSPLATNIENRVLKVYGKYIVGFKMSIYNRWGEKVYSSNDIQEGWDGKFKGKLAPIGIYNYRVEIQTLDKRNIQRIGSSQLIY